MRTVKTDQTGCMYAQSDQCLCWEHIHFADSVMSRFIFSLGFQFESHGASGREKLKSCMKGNSVTS